MFFPDRSRAVGIPCLNSAQNLITDYVTIKASSQVGEENVFLLQPKVRDSLMRVSTDDCIIIHALGFIHNSVD